MPMIDLHCDTILRIWEEGCQEGLRHNSLHVDLEKLRASESMAQFFALFIDLKETREKGQEPWDFFLELYDLYQKEMEKNKDIIVPVTSYQEVLEAHGQGKLSAILTLEEGGILEGQIERLHQIYQMGVRLVTLTWNYPNTLGFPNGMNSMEHSTKGLTPFGVEVVETMNHLGMLVDTSHLSDAGFWDVLKISKAPVMASHSNARAVREVNRNMSDDMLRALGNAGGVAGLNFCPYFVNEESIATIESLCAHLNHMVNVGGEDLAALGTDFDGITGVLEVEHIGQMDKLLYALEKTGLHQRQLDKIWYGNASRIMANVLK